MLLTSDCLGATGYNSYLAALNRVTVTLGLRLLAGNLDDKLCTLTKYRTAL